MYKKKRLAKKANKEIGPTLATKIRKSPIKQTTYQMNELSNKRSSFWTNPKNSKAWKMSLLSNKETLKVQM
jgi:hypothetical protein